MHLWVIAGLQCYLIGPSKPLEKVCSECLRLQGDNTTNGAQNINALLDARPDAVNPIIGYNILPTAKTLTDLKAGQTLDTTDTAKLGNSVNGAPQTLQITVNSNTGTAAQVNRFL